MTAVEHTCGYCGLTLRGDYWQSCNTRAAGRVFCSQACLALFMRKGKPATHADPRKQALHEHEDWEGLRELEEDEREHEAGVYRSRY